MRFGEARLLRGGTERTFFRLFGIADPAHYLHHLYLCRFLDAHPGFAPNRILDAGSGRGDHSIWLARRFPTAEVVGLDIDEGRITRTRDLVVRLGIPNLRFELQDVTQYRGDGRFDLVVSIDVLEHIEDLDAALANLASHCSGKAFFHIPTARPRPVPLSRHLQGLHEWAEHEHHELLTAEQFEEKVRRAGFRVDGVTRTFGRRTGELAVSLFSLPFANTPLNRLAQLVLALPSRVLVHMDGLGDSVFYATAVAGSMPG